MHETEIGDRRPSEAVVEVVSAIRDVEPNDLPPLYEAIDPDALDAVCSDAGTDTQPTVQFSYEGLLVTVSAPDVISVVEP